MRVFLSPRLFIGGACCGALALMLAGCSPATNSSANNQASANSSNTSTSTSGVTGNEAANSAVISATPAAGQTPPAAAVASVWVPGHDDKLHLRPVSRTALDAQKKFKNPVAALNDIMRMAPQYFPPHARVLDWHDDGKTISLNFNRPFVDTNFWSKRGEGRTELAVYAIVNSAATSAGGSKPVVLEVEKTPIQHLGEMDASDSIEPSTRLQSSSADTGISSQTNSSGAAGQGEP